ncbi:hypothetical protein BJX61DRAFT_539334 [Aspergillus egyptiacus]|nr:hypothetical protein BJX61DRAFT_539334 [Aspergillus egyptiacus]
MPATEEVKAMFEPLARAEGPAFFQHVVDDVDWTVKGAFCEVSGHYHSKAEFSAGIKALSETWTGPMRLTVQNVICDGRQAAVELKAVDMVCKNGLPFTNEYTWICEFNDENKIVKVRAYMDT